MARPAPLSGFPEWLPPQRMVEQQPRQPYDGTDEAHGEFLHRGPRAWAWGRVGTEWESKGRNDTPVGLPERESEDDLNGSALHRLRLRLSTGSQQRRVCSKEGPDSNLVGT
jgi:hypothetical protein